MSKNEYDQGYQYEPTDTELFLEIDSFLNDHVPATDTTPNELEEITELEAQQEEMEYSIINFLNILYFNYIVSKKPAYIEFYQKIYNKIQSSYSKFRKEKNNQQFESRTEMVQNYLDQLDEILVEIEDWKACNLNEQS